MEQKYGQQAAQNQQVVPVTTKKEVAAAIGNSGIADSILASFNKLAEQGQLVFPKGYALGNQLKLMYASISQNGNVTKATPISIGESLANAAIQGLEIDKNQVYFIVYDRKMQMFRSYFGDVAVAKRSGLVKEISARVIYKGDEYDIETNDEGKEFVTGHRSSLANRDNEIEGAYAWAVLPDGRREYCIMTWKEIQKNWSKSKAPGTQKDFPQEMSKRTVIRRLVKMIFNTAPTDMSDEAKAIVGSYNRTTKDEYADDTDYSKGGARQEAKTTVSNSIIEEEEEPPFNVFDDDNLDDGVIGEDGSDGQV